MLLDAANIRREINIQDYSVLDFSGENREKPAHLMSAFFHVRSQVALNFPEFSFFLVLWLHLRVSVEI